MRSRVLAVFDLLVAVGCGLGAWACWAHGVRGTAFQRAGGVPAFDSTSYSGGWIFVGSVLAIVAAAFALDLIRRLRIPSRGILDE